MVTIGLHLMPPLQKGIVKTNIEKIIFTAKNLEMARKLKKKIFKAKNQLEIFFKAKNLKIVRTDY